MVLGLVEGRRHCRGSLPGPCQSGTHLFHASRHGYGDHRAQHAGRGEAAFQADADDNMAFGRSMSVDDVADAHLNRTVIFNNMVEFFASHDVLACPVSAACRIRRPRNGSRLSRQGTDGLYGLAAFRLPRDDGGASLDFGAGRTEALPSHRHPADRLPAARPPCWRRHRCSKQPPAGENAD